MISNPLTNPWLNSHHRDCGTSAQKRLLAEANEILAADSKARRQAKHEAYVAKRAPKKAKGNGAA